MHTVVGESSGRYRERGSRFLAFLYPVGNEEENRERLDSLAGEHHAARHLCWAMRLPDLERWSDAGEPHGTAGMPLLQLLRGEDLVLCGLAVVRYFGGVKLGAGNLARAYRSAGDDALTAARRVTLMSLSSLTCSVDPARIGELYAILSRMGVRILDQDFGELTVLNLGVDETRGEELRLTLERLGLTWEEGPRLLLPVQESRTER